MAIKENFKTLSVQTFGFGQFKIIGESKLDIRDILILDVNEGFSTIFEVNTEACNGKKISELEGLMAEKMADWKVYIADAFRNKSSYETTVWLPHHNDYYHVTILPSYSDYFAIVLQKDMAISLISNLQQSDESALMGLDMFFDNSHEAMLLVENKGTQFKFLKNNQIHKEITGYLNLKGNTPIGILGEEIGSKLNYYYNKCLETGERICYEQTYNFKGEERVWNTEITPIYGPNLTNYLLCASKDITDIRRIQTQNEVLTDRLKSMFNSHEAVMLIIKPYTGEIIDANPSAVRFYGYNRNELRTLLITDINMLPYSEVNKYRMLTLEKKQTVFIFPHRLKDGTIRLVEVYSCPIYDGEEKLLYSIIFDVTDRENYKEDLFKEKEVLSKTLNSIGDGVVTTDSSGVITGLNKMAESILDLASEEVEGVAFEKIFNLRNLETKLPIRNPVQEVLKSGEIITLPPNTILINKDNRIIHLEDSAAPIISEIGEILGVVMVFRDISNKVEQQSRLEYLKTHDKLTGLYNRTYMEQYLEQIGSKRYQTWSVIIGDINGLKVVNDLYGQETGNILLKGIASVMKKICDKEDIIVRSGGDEFIVFSQNASLEVAEQKIMNIKQKLSLELGVYNKASISFGCAVKTRPYVSLKETISEAEENMHHQKMLDAKSYRNAMISALLATLYEKSSETEEHSKRLEEISHLIGKQLKLSSSEMDNLSLLSYLHDIGKIKISKEVLQKNTILTQDEWKEMKTHSEAGYRIAQSSLELSSIAPYILYHHEKWDGTGYPNNLCGEEIPLLSRIISIADAYDAMTNDRVYRKALNEDEAILELEENAGTQFDPKLVRIFIQELEKRRLKENK